jgi:hypothetical protein
MQHRPIGLALRWQVRLRLLSLRYIWSFCWLVRMPTHLGVARSGDRAVVSASVFAGGDKPLCPSREGASRDTRDTAQSEPAACPWISAPNAALPMTLIRSCSREHGSSGRAEGAGRHRRPRSLHARALSRGRQSNSGKKQVKRGGGNAHQPTAAPAIVCDGRTHLR